MLSPRLQGKKLNRNLAKSSLVLAGVVVALLLSELVLILFLKPEVPDAASINPNGLYYRLQAPNAMFRYNIEGLYHDARRATFRTTPLGTVSSAEDNTNKSVVLFLGGSSTECRYIDEGLRWPELSAGTAVNAGRSGNTLADSVQNLEYLISEHSLRPEYVVVMHAYNDLALDYLFRDSLTDGQHSAERFALLRRANLSPSRAEGDSGSKLLALIERFWNAMNAPNVLEAMRNSYRNVDNLPAVSTDAFDAYMAERRPVLVSREHLLTRLVELGRTHGFRLVLVTQPNAYLSDYRPYSETDLRDYATFGGHRLTVDQMRKALGILNQETRQFTVKHDVQLVDLESAFVDGETSDLFYDGIHMTARGAKLAAQHVRSALTKIAH